MIRVLSGKLTYIRLNFHFLNAEVITCNATPNIFSSCLLNCTASAQSQLILPGRQPGGEAHLQTTAGDKDTEGTFDSNRVTECLHWCKSSEQELDLGHYKQLRLCGYTLKLQNHTAYFSPCLSSKSSVRLLQNIEEGLWECPVFFSNPCRATLQKLAMSPCQCPVSTSSLILIFI